jgi:hypothetical protein
MKPSSSVNAKSRSGRENVALRMSRVACLSLSILVFVNIQPASSFASVVVETTVKEMMDASELVFEGQVIDVVSKVDMSGHQIHTFVTFQISDVIKGNYSQSKIVLSFLGGSVGGLTLEISDMRLPGFGEKGIYFVETLQHRQVHPLYGWDQGHFVIKTDGEGVQRVRTHNQFKVIGIGSVAPGRIQLSREGVAKGLIISDDPRDKGMSVSEFKTRLRDIGSGRP